MKKLVPVLMMTLFLACTTCESQEKQEPKPVISAETYFEHVKFLGDKKMEGRLPGTEFAKKASQYIADKFKSSGIEPKGEDKTYFQKVTFTARGKEYKCCNVIGFIPGSDDKLKEEVIVVMGHYDHVGKGVYAVKSEYSGKICPGANDNASGAAGVIEVGRAIRKEGLKLKRSVLLLATTGEEAGLHGARQYVKKPAVALEKTMAVINLDMIGGYERGVAAMGVHMSQQFDKGLDKALQTEDLNVVRQKIAGRGDNQCFNERYIPSLFFWTGYGEHYHSPTDTVDKINKEKGAAICRLVVRLVEYLADEKEIVSWLGKPRGSKKPYLGVSTNEVAAGVVITEVGDGTPAEKAGLKKGDVIDSVDGRRTDTYNDFIAALNAHKPGDKVKFKIQRGEETKEIEVTLGER